MNTVNKMFERLSKKGDVIIAIQAAEWWSRSLVDDDFNVIITNIGRDGRYFYGINAKTKRKVVYRVVKCEEKGVNLKNGYFTLRWVDRYLLQDITDTTFASEKFADFFEGKWDYGLDI